MGIYPKESIVNFKNLIPYLLLSMRNRANWRIFKLFVFFPLSSDSLCLCYSTISYSFLLPWDLPTTSTLASADLPVCPSPSHQGADSRDSQMNQALRLLESEHQELQARIECLQEDRDLCSSDTQHLQGTHPPGGLGGLWEPRERGLGWKGVSRPFVCLVDLAI